MNRLTTVAAEVKNEPLEQFARRAGRFVADYGTRTVYKYVMIPMTPQAILRAAPAAWGRIFDRGTLLVDVEKGRARIRLQEFTADRAGCARITGFFEFVGERSAPDLKVEHTACRLDRAPECVWDLVWTG